MRNCQLTILLIFLLLACSQTLKGSNIMSETVINGIKLSFTGPEQLPLSVVLRDSPAYDGPCNFFTVSFTNKSGRTRKLPFDELQRNVVMRYRNPVSHAEEVDNQTPPPKMDGAVDTLVVGETKMFQVIFNYPTQIVTMKDNIAVIEFCVQWKKEWLRDQAYTEVAYDWNESYQLCRQIRIVDVKNEV